MAHEIESIAWVGDRPWHGLGTEVLHCMTAAEAIKEAKLDWVVEKRKLFTPFVPPDDAPLIEVPRMIEVPDTYAIVRVNDQKPLGAVGARFTPLQNMDAFSFFDEVVQSKDAKYETAGSLRGGKLVWMTCKMNKVIGWEEDPIEGYLALINAHDGTRQVMFLLTPIRIVCKNTMDFAIASSKASFEMRHTSGLMERVKDAREALGLAVSYCDDLFEILVSMKDRTMDATETDKYVSGLFPTKIKLGENMPGFEDTLNVEYGPRIKKYVELTKQLVETGKGADLPGVRGTVYGALNAAVEFADHYQPVRENGGKNGSMLLRKLESIWFGSAAKFKQRAFDSATDLLAA